MIRNYFKIAFRTLARHRGYSLINALGLTLGMACGLLIFLIVKYHLSFDTYHAKVDRAYRVVTEFHFDGVGYSGGVPTPMATGLRQDYAFLDKTAMVVGQHNNLMAITDAAGAIKKKFREEQTICFVEPQYFDILDYRWLAGNPRTALLQPGAVVITQKIAQKYFGTQPPLGRTLRMENRLDLRVTGVLANLPPNTDRKHEIFISYPTLKTYPNYGGSGLDNWGGVNSDTHCFVLLKPGSSPEQLRRVLPAVVKKYQGAESVPVFRYQVIPLKQMHFEENYDGPMQRSRLWVLGLIGTFLVLTACINFVNLATAQALGRSKEVGVRKVLGGTRGQLFWQFIAETAAITGISLVLAIGLARLAMPYLNQLFEDEIPFNLLGDGLLWAFAVALAALVVLLSGSYPGLVLSGFRPVQALKGKITTQQVGGVPVRRGLVIAQFVISQLLIIGTIVVTRQMNYLRQKDIGFNPSAILMVPVPTQKDVSLQTLGNRLAQVPGVDKLSFCWTAPTAGSNNTSNARYDTRQQDEKWQVSTKHGDVRYLETFGLKLVAGRNLPEGDTARGYLVNEAFVRKLGLKSPQEAVGKNLKMWNTWAPIVGVLKDWNSASLRSEIEPLVIWTNKGMYSNCALKVSTQNLTGSLKAVEKIWNQTFPDYLYESQFLDERIREFYRLEEVTMKLIRLFALVAIFIGCLGLYGLVSFMAETRTKEVGIRKVLGASTGQILWLFGREFARLIAVAFVVAAPAAWWLMGKWLQDYSYRVPIDASVFALAMGVTALIATLTVGYRSTRSALANPVKSLRAE